MSTTTDAQICYGILFDDGFTFPWDDEKYESDIEDWWEDLHNFKPSIDLYKTFGQKPPKEAVALVVKERSDFYKQFPLPVTLVNYCYIDTPMFILAIPSSCITANRGYPEKIYPASLSVSENEIESLLHFCNKYCPQIDNPNNVYLESDASWFLSSYWG